MSRKIIGIKDKVPLKLLIPLSFQHTFAMFGGSLLIPIILGADPSLAFLMNGIGTILFILATRGEAPAFLGSSGAFLAPALIVISDPRYGYPYALGGFLAVGMAGIILGQIFKIFGTKFIDIIFPPAAMGMVVALIGLELIPFSITESRIGANLSDPIQRNIFFVTLATAVFGAVLFKKFFSIIPILISIVVGYIYASFLGVVDFTPIMNSSLINIPNFQFPKVDIIPILTMLPVVLVIAAEHISHQVVTSTVVKKDLLKEPGLWKTFTMDCVSTSISALCGSVPTTTYGENVGVMAVTKVYSTRVIFGAAIISILMAFIGPFSAIIASIPGAVVGGVTFLLYGMIGTSGLRLVIEKKVNYNKTKNLILTSIVLVIGLSGLQINVMGIPVKGMILSALVTVVLGISFYIFEKLNLMNKD